MADSRKKVKQIFANYNSFKTKLNAYKADLVKDSSQELFNYFFNTYGDYYFTYTNENEITSRFASLVWERTVNIIQKAIEAQKKTIKDLITSSSDTQFTQGDLTQAQKATALNEFVDSGQTNLIQSSVLRALRTYINLPNIYNEFDKLIQSQLSNYQIDSDSSYADPLTTDQQLNWLTTTIDKRIEDHQKVNNKIDNATLQSEITKLDNKKQDKILAEIAEFTDPIKLKKDLQLNTGFVLTNRSDGKIYFYDVSKRNYFYFDVNTGEVFTNHTFTATQLHQFIQLHQLQTELAKKTDKITVYTKLESDGRFEAKGTAYTKTETNALLKTINDKNTAQDREINKKINTDTARSEFETQATIQENFGFTDGSGGDIKVKKQLEQVSVGQGSSATLPVPTKPGHLVNKKYFDENKGGGSGGLNTGPFKYLAHFSFNHTTTKFTPTTARWEDQVATAVIPQGHNYLQITSSTKKLFLKTNTYKFIFDTVGNIYGKGFSLRNKNGSNSLNSDIFVRKFSTVILHYDNGWKYEFRDRGGNLSNYNLSSLGSDDIEYVEINERDFSWDWYIFEEGVNTEEYYSKTEINQFRQTTFARLREAIGVQHLTYKFWTASSKSPDTPWTENGDKNGIIGIEKNNDKYFLDTSNTNLFKKGKNYDIQINIFKNGGNNNSGQQLNLFAGSLVDSGSARPDVNAIVQTFDTYQFSVNNSFGPSQANKGHIIREDAYTFNEFNEINIVMRLRKLKNNQLVIETLQPIRKLSQRNDGSYLLTKGDFIAKIANIGNGKFWKFGIKTGNWDNITRVEFFVRGESE